MPKIFFPSRYKKAILGKTKTVTLRIGNEVGKYKINHIYNAHSYGKFDWKRKIKIIKNIKTTVGELSSFDIPKKSIMSLVKNNHLENSNAVEIVYFKYL